MERNKRWAIALDDSKMDDDLIRYVSGLCGVFSPEKVYLITVLKGKKSYSYATDEYFEAMNQLEEEIRQGIQSKAEKYFKGGNTEFEILVEYGTPLEEIIQLVVSRTITLVFAGRKRESAGSGVVSDRLSRNLPCDFLMVPEGKECIINNVLVPTDFSEHSLLALTRVAELKQVSKNIKTYVFHGYHVPMGYSKSGKSFEEFAEIMRSHAEKEMKRWLPEESDGITPVLSLINDQTVEELVVSLSTEKAIDLIVIGSKGQSAASLALLGSNTMKVIAKNHSIPLLIVKKPGENQGFIQALRKI